MQKSQVFKVKGMQRDASMPNANGEFAYEIINMRLMPAEDGAGFSLTNEKGTGPIKLNTFKGSIIGQCATLDSLIVFTTDHGTDYIYQIKESKEPAGEWNMGTLYSGNLGFSEEYPIEALFNYETKDIQKVYWIDGINQLRCINITTGTIANNDQQFDSIKQLNSLPNVDITRTTGGSFTAGVIQYYITYFSEFMTESPIIYTSPLLYIAHNNRGANTNDKVNTAFKISLSNLDRKNWEYIRIYATHRTSLDSTPEASIISEIRITDAMSIDFIDYGSNRVSIAPSDLYFIGGKPVKAGTMTVKDQVLFLGNLNLETSDQLDYKAIQKIFDDLRSIPDATYFRCDTRKSRNNNLKEYEETSYKYDNQLNNSESITHYKYGEKYRFGISVMDKWGNWSNPIWIKDAFIEVPPEQTSINTLELPCPQLELDYVIPNGIYANKSLYDVLFTELGVKGIKPLVVFPSLDERKVLAQGVVCPTVYNLKDRKENGPYAQASWFMRPNAPINIWGTSRPSHNSDIINKEDNPSDGYRIFSKQSIENISIEASKWLDRKMSLVYDDLSIYKFNNTVDPQGYIAAIKNGSTPEILYDYDYDSLDFNYIAKDLISAGSWVEFRHNYALRTKGWTWGPQSDWYQWSFGIDDDNEWSHDMYPLLKETEDISENAVDNSFIYRTWESTINGKFPKDTTGMVALDVKDIPEDVANLNRIIFYKFRLGGARCAELDTSRFGATIPVNRFYGKDLDRKTWRGVDLIKFNTGNSAFYVDNSIVTFNSPEIEMNEAMVNVNLEGYDFRIVGMIPLTATVSDMSLETSGNLYNPSADDNISLGFKKFVVRNKNIGHHGFKGMVTHSMFYSGNNHPGDTYTFNNSGSNLTEETNAIYHDRYVAAFPLHPWQSTGNIPGFLPDWSDKNNYSKIKRKILSNLRYSANTKFFSVGTLEDLGTNKASLNLNGLSIGWKPMNGSNIQWYNATDSSIIKLQADGYQKDLVYSANIDSIALATAGENNDIPIRIYQYFYGRKLVPSAPLEFSEYSPYLAGASFDDVYKEGVGSSIKYKSSPHAVIGFNGIPVSLHDNVSKYTQEILPAFDSINNEGRDLETISTTSSINAGVLYEDSSIISMPHQSVLPTDGWANYGLPGYNDADKITNQPTYGWLWLGEIYKEVDPTFGGDSEYALQHNSWEIGGISQLVLPSTKVPSYVDYEGFSLETTYSISYSDDLQFKSNDNSRNAISFYITDSLALDLLKEFMIDTTKDLLKIDFTTVIDAVDMPGVKEEKCSFKFVKNGNFSKCDVTITIPSSLGYSVQEVFLIGIPTSIFSKKLRWTQGDTYYQRFDTLKTYAYSDQDENSIVDITSFMVETRINIDGRTDRNRGQESNLQMSPSNFNLINDIYSQRDNFFTYRILDDDVQNRKMFPTQITWSLTKTAGATIDAWLNITLASVLDLDGTKGKLSALKTFNNNIIAFQDKGISTILFNSRVQIPTSEAVPIQIANSGKVEGQQYFTTDLGCQDKWNIVTSPQGLYFVDYYNKSIYKFNGQIEDLSTANGFRGWCDKNITSNSSIVGYYDKRNKEVIFYSDTFEKINDINIKWLGFSELTNAFSSFYTYPKARLISLQDDNLWLYNQSVYSHQTGKYNNLLGEESPYGLTVVVRNDSNITKIFNSIEFRSDLYEDSNLRNFETFDTIQIEDEHNGKTSAYLDYNPYRPSNLKKRSRTWRAAIPRVGNGYNRYTNQWAKVGLWMTHKHNSMAVEHAEKIILHDMAVWYTE